MKAHFAALLRPLFPKDADFRQIDRRTDELVYRVDWRMPSTGRPNMRSRPIEICFSRDTQDDYRDAEREEDREAMDRRIVDYVRRRLEIFDPKHEFYRHVPVPAERWEISPRIASV